MLLHHHFFYYTDHMLITLIFFKEPLVWFCKSMLPTTDLASHQNADVSTAGLHAVFLGEDIK